MSGTFSGQLSLGGEQVPVDLNVSPEAVRLATGSAEIGTWPLGQVRVVPNGDGSFQLEVEEDSVGFVPAEPDAFEEVVDFLFAPSGDSVWSPSFPGSEAPLPGASTTDPPAPSVGENPSNGGDPSDSLWEPEMDEPRAEDVEEPPIEPPEETRAGSMLDGVAEPELPEETSPAFEPTDESSEAEDELELPPEPSDRAVPEEEPSASPVPFAVDDGDDGESGEDLRSQLSKPSLVRRIGKLAGVAALVVGLLAVLAFAAPSAFDAVTGLTTELTSDEPPAEAPADTDASAPTSQAPEEAAPSTAPPTTEATSEENLEAQQVVSTPPAAGGLFDRPSARFVETWNQVGGGIAAALLIDSPGFPDGPFEEPLTSYITLTGAVAPDATLDRLSVVIDPAGPASSDLLGIQTLGVALAVADPELDGPGRAALLARLGLDVDDPQLAGVDGQVVEDGVTYRLVYEPDTQLLTLSLTPAG